MTPARARNLLVAALILGVAGNWLLRADVWRAGFVLWVLATLAVAFAAWRGATAADPTAQRERRVLLAAAAVLAVLLVLRDAEMLYALDLFAFVVVCALIAWRAGGRPLSVLEPRDAVAGGVATVAALVGGAPTLALKDAVAAPIDADRRRSYGGFAIGAAAAAPVLLVVALLLGSADPLFAAFLERTGTLLDASLVGHVLGSALFAWVAAGAIRGSIAPVGLGSASFRFELRLPFPTVAPLLGGLAVLLSAWIGLQVRTLFGGTTYVAETAGVTVAEYARQGFFELIVIAGIVLAALLVADEVLDRSAGRERASFRAFGLVLIGLVSAVLVSALLRLSVYLRFYGLTDERVLALAVLVWVAAVLVWFSLTVLRDVRGRFAPGVLVLSAIWLGGLNIANPERWIVETNLQRAERGLDFDIAYHAKLSGDAVPALLRGADRLGAERAAQLRADLAAVWSARAAERTDWRSWSLPHANAVRRAAVAVP